MWKTEDFLISSSQVLANIPENEGIEIFCRANENFYKNKPPIPILKRKFFPVQWKAPPTKYRNGQKDSSSLCQHFHGIYLNTNF